MPDPKNYTEAWKKLFRENCMEWDPAQQQRFINICNDPTDVDQEEYESCLELVEEINGHVKKTG